MKLILYKCDNVKCRKMLKSPHLSINFEQYSGWVAKNELTGEWKHQGITEGIYQFCDEICLGTHFMNLAKKLET